MYLPTTFGRLAFLEQGRGLPLICLPAYPLAGQFFYRPFAENLPAARLILPDYRGSGDSSLGEGEACTVEVLAEDMFGLLDYLGAPRAVVLGVSLGGYVALAMYARHPERIQGLILADTRAEADGPEAVKARHGTVVDLRSRGTEALRPRVQRLFAPSTRENRPDLVNRAWQAVQKQDPEGLARLMLGMALRPDRSGLLARIRVPTLVLGGEQDATTPPADMQGLAGRIPGAEFHVIQDAGHLTPLEQPRAFAARVGPFLRRLEARIDVKRESLGAVPGGEPPENRRTAAKTGEGGKP